MARIRTIKPDYWTDEKVVECTPLARLLFIGLWNFADDEGRVLYRPTKFKMQILPNDNIDISSLLGEIRGKKMITVYEVENEVYLQINNFAIHQKIDKRSNSKLPPPPENPPESPRIPTTERIKERDQGKEEERIKEEESKKVSIGAFEEIAPTKKGSRIPVELLPEEWQQFCLEERPDLNPNKVFELFSDYWKAKPGKDGVKLDWLATWRNWVRNQKSTTGGNYEPRSKHHQLAEAATRAIIKIQQST